MLDQPKRQKMPCPNCGNIVTGDYEKKHCVSCGAWLVKFSPIFAINAPPYGWRWMQDEANHKCCQTGQYRRQRSKFLGSNG